MKESRAQELRNKVAELMNARVNVPLSFLQYTSALAELCDEAINTVELLENSIKLAKKLQGYKQG